MALTRWCAPFRSPKSEVTALARSGSSARRRTDLQARRPV